MQYHRWEYAMFYSPDFRPVAVILTNGLRYFSVLYLKGRMSLHRDIGEAIDRLMEGRFIN